MFTPNQPPRHPHTVHVDDLAQLADVLTVLRAADAGMTLVRLVKVADGGIAATLQCTLHAADVCMQLNILLCDEV